MERIGYGESGPRGRTIDGELIAKSTTAEPSRFAVGDRVFHIKFGNGNVSGIEGNKLTIDFDRAGQKRVLDGSWKRPEASRGRALEPRPAAPVFGRNAMGSESKIGDHENISPDEFPTIPAASAAF